MALHVGGANSSLWPIIGATKTAASILSKVKKPTQAEAKAISQMFSTSKNEKKRPFDPLADSIVEPQKKKKLS